MSHILIVDDDSDVCRTINKRLTKEGYGIEIAGSIAEARDLLQAHTFDLILLDIHLPDGTGIDIINEINSLTIPPVIIVITGYAEEKSASQAITSGVWDYLEKPFSMTELSLSVARALKYRKALTAARPSLIAREKIIGSSPGIQSCLDLAAKAANSDISVLIMGETGTGKELFAETIHQNSRRCSRNMIVLDCTVLPESLMESTLFGHVKGAFTGASVDREGLIQQANGTTLFLDEIGELPLALQKKLLRVLQEQRFRPVGGEHEVTSDFRMIAATNRNLDQMVAEGTFREDLLYRLNSFTIRVPTLRERDEDIDALAEFHLNRLCRKYDLTVKRFSSDFITTLKAYAWPGNVRELVNTLDRILTIARSEPVIYPIHLPPDIRIKLAVVGFQRGQKESPDMDADGADISVPLKIARQNAVERTEAAYVALLMKRTNGDIREACRVAEIGKSQLYTLLRKYGIEYRE